MPWKLVPPRPGKTKYYYVRGEYLGIRLDHSTGTGDARAAQRTIKTWRLQAERGEFKLKTDTDSGPLSFAKAATAYMQAGGEGKYLLPIIDAWPQKLAADVDQVAIDTLAAQLYPTETAATRNRQVHTPIAAVIHHVGIEKKIKRPKGWKGKKSTAWLEPDQAFALFPEADKIEPEFGLFCRHLCYTGMRLGETLSRKVRDLLVDRAFCYLDDSKNGDARGCHLPPYLVQAYLDQPPRIAREIIARGQFGFIEGGGGRIVEDAGVPFLERDPDAKLFRYHDGGRLRDMLKLAMKNAGLSFPRRQGGFHIFCHTYGSWMHRFGGLDAHGLTDTNRWTDPDSAWRYVHTSASQAAQRADLMPTPNRGQLVEIKRSAG